MPIGDGKHDDAMRTIGEVSRALGIQPHVLRYWEGQFPSLKPVKRSGARRYYRPEDMRLIAEIDRLVHREGYTLRGARQFLEQKQKEASNQEQHSEPDSTAIDSSNSSADFMNSLHAIRSKLAAALQK